MGDVNTQMSKQQLDAHITKLQSQGFVVPDIDLNLYPALSTATNTTTNNINSISNNNANFINATLANIDQHMTPSSESVSADDVDAALAHENLLFELFEREMGHVSSSFNQLLTGNYGSTNTSSLSNVSHHHPHHYHPHQYPNYHNQHYASCCSEYYNYQQQNYCYNHDLYDAAAVAAAAAADELGLFLDCLDWMSPPSPAPTVDSCSAVSRNLSHQQSSLSPQALQNSNALTSCTSDPSSDLSKCASTLMSNTMSALPGSRAGKGTNTNNTTTNGTRNNVNNNNKSNVAHISKMSNVVRGINGTHTHNSNHRENHNHPQACGVKRAAGTSLLVPKPKVVKTGTSTYGHTRHQRPQHNQVQSINNKIAGELNGQQRQHYGHYIHNGQSISNGTVPKAVKHGQSARNARAGVTPIRSLSFNTGSTPNSTQRPLVSSKQSSSHKKQNQSSSNNNGGQAINGTANCTPGQLNGNLNQTTLSASANVMVKQNNPTVFMPSSLSGVGLPPVVSSGRHTKGSTNASGPSCQQYVATTMITNNSSSSSSSNAGNSTNNNTNASSVNVSVQQHSNRAAYNVNYVFQREHDYCGRSAGAVCC